MMYPRLTAGRFLSRFPMRSASQSLTNSVSRFRIKCQRRSRTRCVMMCPMRSVTMFQRRFLNKFPRKVLHQLLCTCLQCIGIQISSILKASADIFKFAFAFEVLNL